MQKLKRRKGRGPAILLILFCLGSILCTACGSKKDSDDGSQGQTQVDSVDAVTMRLEKTQGTVAVWDQEDGEVALQEPLPLYNGYELQSQTESYAWVNLDDTKLVKLDQESGASVYKEGKHLELVSEYGGLFFRVTQPLEEEESLDIRVGTLSVGIRGTCGWVCQRKIDDSTYMYVYILEGTVACVPWENQDEINISAGEMLQVVMEENGSRSWHTEYFTRVTIPEYVWVELGEELQEKVSEILPGEHVSGKDTSSEAEDTQTQADPETMGAEEKIEYYLEFMEGGKERVFEDNVTLFGREIDTISIEDLRDILVDQGLAESRLFTEQIEGLGTQLMYSGDMYAFLDLPVDAVQSQGASTFTTFGWIKEYPAGTDTGVLDIKSGDSIETVLEKMGFTHAAEIGGVLRENPDITVRWSSYDRWQDSWSIEDLAEGDKVSDDIKFAFGVWPGNQYAESEAFMELQLSTMYKVGESSASNAANLNLYFNENYEVYSLEMSQVQNR